MTTILIAGGAGYIGSHTCKALKAAGFTPVVADNLHTGRMELVQFGAFEKADIRDKAAMVAVMEKHRPVAVMHFAALLAVGESVSNPAEYYDVNVQGTWSLLQAMRQTGVQNLIFSSSAAVYGTPEGITTMTEDTPTSPINPYGETKLVMEKMLRDYHTAYGINYTALRYFNAAGADPEGQLGYLYPHPTNLVPVVVNVLAGQQPQLRVFGTDYPTPDGTCVRDYIHVADLADAHVKALQYLLKGGQSTAFNLGTNTGTTVKQVVAALEDASGQKVPTEFVGRRAGDPAILVANAGKAMQTLGWKPQYSDMPTIARTAWAWRKKQMNQG